MSEVTNEVILEAIKDLDKDIKGLKTDVKDLQSDIAGLKTDVKDLQSRVGPIEVQLAEVKKDTTVIKEDIRYFEVRSSNHDKKIFQMEEYLKQA